MLFTPACVSVRVLEPMLMLVCSGSHAVNSSPLEEPAEIPPQNLLILIATLPLQSWARGEGRGVRAY
jgi:hypothetical protein